MPRAFAAHLLRLFAALTGNDAPFSEGSTIMLIFDAMMRRPRALGIACAIGAVVLGLAYMAIAGAPMRYLGINVGALVIGMTMLALLGRTAAADQRWAGGAIIVMAGALLATAILGSEVEGAARWVSLGGLTIQPSLILLPVMLVVFSRTRSVQATAGIVAAAAAMAVQPDRAMAGMLLLCLAVLLVTRRDRHVVVTLAAGVIGFAATLVRADSLPAAPYVDQILYSSFEIHAGVGLAVSGGLALLLVPAIVGLCRDAENRATSAAFGAVWFASIMAAAFGNYPTPIVGYGGSAIIGYALSLFALPRLAEVHAAVGSQTPGTTDAAPSDRHPLIALA
ncbi:hypothetical protein GCM10011329_35600 [Stakelama pacifica]|nr:hypothetical protein GCM10011329_35600 [Stakelama pacifica]